MAEHKMEKKTNGYAFDTCERCKFLKECNRRMDNDYAKTIRCSEFKISKG